MTKQTSNNCDICRHRLDCFTHAAYVPKYDEQYERCSEDLSHTFDCSKYLAFGDKYKPGLFTHDCKNTCHLCENRYACTLHDWKNIGQHEQEPGYPIFYNLPMLCSPKMKAIPLNRFYVFQNWIVNFYKMCAVKNIESVSSPQIFIDNCKKDISNYCTKSDSPNLFALGDAMIENMRDNVIPMLKEIKARQKD